MDPTDVASSPAPLLALPSHFTFHSHRLSFLTPTTGTGKALASMNLDGKTPPTILFGKGEMEEGNLSKEEKLRRERMRQHSTGVTTFQLLHSPPSSSPRPRPNSPTYLLPTPTGLSTFTPQTSTTSSPLTPIYTGTPVDVQSSSSLIFFSQDSDVHVLPPSSSSPLQSSQLTFHPPSQTCGSADFLSQEEMDQYRGYWPLPTSLIYLLVDDTLVPEFTIMHSGKVQPTGEGNEEKHNYPFAGERNPSVKLMIMKLEPQAPLSQRVKNFNNSLQLLPPTPECSEYICRVHTFQNYVFCQWQNRSQTQLTLVCYDTTSSSPTSPKTVLVESTSTWINLNHAFRIISPKTSPLITFLFASERSGYNHLYLYNYSPQTNLPATCANQITSGPWIVDCVNGYCPKSQTVFYSCNSVSAVEKRLCCSKVTGGESVVVTKEKGVHNITMSHDCKYFVDVYSSRDVKPLVRLVKIVVGDYIMAVGEGEGGCEVVRVFHGEEERRVESKVGTENFEHMCRPPSLDSFLNRSNIRLYYSLYLPDPEKHGSPPYPLVVACYGGPHVQRVKEEWSQNVDMRAQSLRSHGVAVVKCDNRGSSRRGVLFEGAIKHDMGNLEVLDQVDCVRHLVNSKVADGNRVGIYGWSYGGYMAAMCLARAPETFHVAVSGAPVTSWDGYDTHYTERYMGTPGSNPKGYFDSSVLSHCDKIVGKLMLVHGLIDENVHFRHTARLINALIKHRKRYDLLLFPDERHSPRSITDRIYMEERIADYFKEHLRVNQGVKRKGSEVFMGLFSKK
ncbi:hypothetical protein TrST_g694 [Triparma strigata]|uniref:Uncharacterized protein n=1 Tax=Triparma strigata TaxID=1606541 RepID=A0A9W7BCH7_9STRA|nr:hypothetical protein TrST_g694 [Triparma strigata]